MFQDEQVDGSTPELVNRLSANRAKYQHRPLNLEAQEIRLLKIYPPKSSTDADVRCKLQNFVLDQSPSFWALSYEWGSPGHELAVKIENRKLKVRENLWDFLSCARRAPGIRGTWFWIDQISIDQGSAVEKQHQVELMGRIYEKASRTLVWINRSAQNPDSAFDFFPIWVPPGDSADYIPTRKRLTTAIRDIAEKTYWSRLWIIQEILLSRDLVVVSPSESIGWSDLSFYSPVYEVIPRFKYLSYMRGKYREQRRTGKTSMIVSWQDACNLSMEASAWDRRDLIYGLLGLVAEDIRIVPDYTATIEEVFARVMVAEMMRGMVRIDESGSHRHLSRLWTALSRLLRIDPIRQDDLYPTFYILGTWLRRQSRTQIHVRDNSSYQSLAHRDLCGLINDIHTFSTAIRSRAYHQGLFRALCSLIGIDITFVYNDPCSRCASNRAIKRCGHLTSLHITPSVFLTELPIKNGDSCPSDQAISTIRSLNPLPDESLQSLITMMIGVGREYSASHGHLIDLLCGRFSRTAVV